MTVTDSPLTSQQRWLWNLVQQFPTWNCAVPYAFCLKGELSVALLQRALDEAVGRHSALRTRVSTVAGEPRAEDGEAHAGRFDVRKVESPDDARGEFARFAAEIVDPASGPLFRVRLLELSADEHWLLLALHRLVADCSSAEQLFQELWAVYHEFAQGRPSPLAAAPPQYTDYAFWQQARGTEWCQRQQDYWTKRLTGASALKWPVDFSVATPESGQVALMSCRFGKALSDDLQGLARRTHCLAAMVMLSAYIAVVWRWCGQRDFVLPFNIAGRQSEHKLVVGCFSHLLYLRIELTGRESFRDLLGQVSQEFFRALTHQDFGEHAARQPHLLTGTFCQWVTWQTHESAANSNSTGPTRLRVERLPLSEFGKGLSMLPPGMVDIDLTFFDTVDGIYVQGLYRTDRFLAASATRLVEELRSATEYFVAHPSAPVEAARS